MLTVDLERKIVERAIKTALANGWKPRNYDAIGLDDEKIIAFDVYKYGTKKVTFFNDDIISFSIPLFEIIFNHGFAKALWGVEPFYILNKPIEKKFQKWEYHLCELVLSDNPIEYLGRTNEQ